MLGRKASGHAKVTARATMGKYGVGGVLGEKVERKITVYSTPG
jgi:hypothetical protein